MNHVLSASVSVPHRGVIEPCGRKQALIFLGRISFWFESRGPPERTLMREQRRKGVRWIGDENELNEWTRSAPEWREVSNFDESGLAPLSRSFYVGITNVIKLMWLTKQSQSFWRSHIYVHIYILSRWNYTRDGTHNASTERIIYLRIISNYFAQREYEDLIIIQKFFYGEDKNLTAQHMLIGNRTINQSL